ncbi:hypothetical protein BGLA2_2170006 [Burkholderia gladioli]|nr:hypothetical protein BGLA2_2170006 [Burkholderia gladioli]
MRSSLRDFEQHFEYSRQLHSPRTLPLHPELKTLLKRRHSLAQPDNLLNCLSLDCRYIAAQRLQRH